VIATPLRTGAAMLIVEVRGSEIRSVSWGTGKTSDIRPTRCLSSSCRLRPIHVWRLSSGAGDAVPLPIPDAMRLPMWVPTVASGSGVSAGRRLG
jgi:hypothetical protein